MQNPLPDHDVAGVPFVVPAAVEIPIVFRKRGGGLEEIENEVSSMRQLLLLAICVLSFSSSSSAQTYQFTKHYFSGIQVWNLVLQADRDTQRDVRRDRYC